MTEQASRRGRAAVLITMCVALLSTSLATRPRARSPSTTTYDELGRVATTTDPGGVVTTNTWTLRGELASRSVSGAGTVEYSYLADGNLAWVEDALDNRTSFTYDARGRRATRTDPAGKVWTTSHNAAGELISETDPLSRTTSYTYDLAGRLATRSDASGRTRTNTWSLDGMLTTQVDTDGTDTRTSTFGYDAIGRRTSLTVDASPVKSYTHNAAGDLTSETTYFDDSERTLSYDYDVAGRRTTLRRADGTSLTYSYDAAGRIDSLVAGEVAADSFAGMTGHELDQSKWTTTAAGGAAATIQDNAGNLVVPASPSASVEVESLASGATNGDTVLTYSFESASTPTRLTIDQRRTATGDRYSVEVTADSSTAAITKTVGGVTTPLATFSVPVSTDAQQLRFAVDGSDILAKVWSAGDPEPGGWSATTSDSAVTDDGVPGIRVEAGSGSSNTVTVDEWIHDDPSSAPVELVSYGWDGDSNLVEEAFADGGTRDWTWFDGRVVEFDQDIAGANRTTTLGYDSAGRISSETTGGVTTTNGYDAADQLLSATPTSGPDSTWTYNSRGHRTSQTVGTVTTAYTYDDAGQLTSATPSTGPATSFGYDAGGRRVSETTGVDVRSFIYSPRGELETIETPSGASITRVTAGGGLSTEVASDLSGTSYRFYDWDHTSGLAELSTIATTGATSSETRSLVRAGGAPWGVVQSTGGVDAVASDVHHSAIDSTATDLAAAGEYTAWGEPTTGVGSDPVLGYRGELSVAGLTHLRARDYDPTTAQFHTMDPLPGVDGTAVANHPYHYANNNPLNLIDPTGMRASDAEFSTGFAAGAASCLAIGGTMAIADGPLLAGDALALTCVVVAQGAGIVTVLVTDLIDSLLSPSTSSGPANDAPPSRTQTTQPAPVPIPHVPSTSRKPCVAPQTSLEQPCEGMLVYRVHGPNAGNGEVGASWTPVDPRSVGPGSFRDLAGLPDSNPGTHLVIGELADVSAVADVRPALACGPPHCQESRPGGLLEYLIPSNLVSVINRTYVALTPPY